MLMFTMVRLLVAVLKRYSVFVVCSGITLVVFFLVLPRILDFIEFRFDIALPYEAVIRLMLLALYAILLVGGLYWVSARGQRKHLIVWLALAISLVAFAVVAFGDQTHRLMEEFSWIRYTTGLFLLLASTTAFLLRRGVVSWLFGVGFFYAALDEVLEIHEKLGRLLGAAFSLPPNITDYITIAYAVVGLAVVLIVVRYGRQWVKESPCAASVLLAGVVTYALSTVFDTVDFWALARLRTLGAVLAANPGSYFADAMYIFWAPRNFLNGLEELLEQIAAGLFFAAMVSAVFERHARVWMDQAVGVKRIKLLLVPCFLFFAAVVAIVWLGGQPSVPLIPGGGATVIASAPQGLFHADDIAYHLAWGVVVANEGRGEIYQWKDGVWRRIPDPERLVKDPDSVTADDTYLYVADATQGIIFTYREDEGWGTWWTRDDGIIHTEALAVVGDTIYVLDEIEKTITKLMRNKSAERWHPDHPEWIAPESIAYDSARKELYVSDDKSGAIFTVDFEKHIVRKIATLPRPEDITILPDGSLLATDTRVGAIFRIYTDTGRTEKIVQFKRPYRDLQGIAYDGERVYVISADGFGSSSFMPSFLWQLWITLA